MAHLRLKRNLLKSLKDYFIDELTEDGWTDIIVDFQTKQTTTTVPAPKLLISILDMDNKFLEIGSGKFRRYPTIVLRIFGTDNANREDLSDWTIEKLERNIPYNRYVLSKGIVTSKILAGSISIQKIIRDEHELGSTNPDVLDSEDRYRHNITFSCHVGLI